MRAQQRQPPEERRPLMVRLPLSLWVKMDRRRADTRQNLTEFVEEAVKLLLATPKVKS